MVELKNRNIKYNFIFSGQHKETIDEILDNFGLEAPNIVLYQGKDITGIFQMMAWTAKIIFFCMRNKKSVWRDDEKGVVLNHGDTFSTLLGSILAKIAGLKAGHVESGLRSFNFLHPFPEELTRICVFYLTDIYFASSDWAINNLKKFQGKKVNTHANTIVDCIKHCKNQTTSTNVPIPSAPYALVSIHRFENIFYKRQLSKILFLLNLVSKQIKLVFILHKPTKEKLKKFNLYKELSNNHNIELRPRYDYFGFNQLLRGSKFVITDGGSNQEECYYYQKPCLLMRDKSERLEGIGENVVISHYKKELVQEFLTFSNNYKPNKQLQNTESPSATIIDSLVAEGFT